MAEVKTKTKPKKKIFLIEDELDIMYVNKTALRAAGFDVVEISTGKDVMEKLKKVQDKKDSKPDLILLDLVLPDINGLEILSAIRKDSVTKNIKVFILSNYTSDALVNIKYIKPDKFIVKSSLTPTQLAELVNHELQNG